MDSLIDLTGLPQDLLKIIGSYFYNYNECMDLIEAGELDEALVQVQYMTDVAKLFELKQIKTGQKINQEVTIRNIIDKSNQYVNAQIFATLLTFITLGLLVLPRFK